MNDTVNPDQCANLSLQKSLKIGKLSDDPLNIILQAPESRGEAWMSWYHLSVSSVTCNLPSFSSCWVNLIAGRGVHKTILGNFVNKPADEEGTQILVIPPEETL